MARDFKHRVQMVGGRGVLPMPLRGVSRVAFIVCALAAWWMPAFCVAQGTATAASASTMGLLLTDEQIRARRVPSPALQSFCVPGTFNIPLGDIDEQLAAGITLANEPGAGETEEALSVVVSTQSGSATPLVAIGLARGLSPHAKHLAAAADLVAAASSFVPPGQDAKPDQLTPERLRQLRANERPGDLLNFRVALRDLATRRLGLPFQWELETSFRSVLVTFDAEVSVRPQASVHFPWTQCDCQRLPPHDPGSSNVASDPGSLSERGQYERPLYVTASFLNSLTVTSSAPAGALLDEFEYPDVGLSVYRQRVPGQLDNSCQDRYCGQGPDAPRRAGLNGSTTVGPDGSTGSGTQESWHYVHSRRPLVDPSFVLLGNGDALRQAARRQCNELCSAFSASGASHGSHDRSLRSPIPLRPFRSLIDVVMLEEEYGLLLHTPPAEAETPRPAQNGSHQHLEPQPPDVWTIRSLWMDSLQSSWFEFYRPFPLAGFSPLLLQWAPQAPQASQASQSSQAHQAQESPDDPTGGSARVEPSWRVVESVEIVEGQPPSCPSANPYDILFSRTDELFRLLPLHLFVNAKVVDFGANLGQSTARALLAGAEIGWAFEGWEETARVGHSITKRLGLIGYNYHTLNFGRLGALAYVESVLPPRVDVAMLLSIYRNVDGVFRDRMLWYAISKAKHVFFEGHADPVIDTVEYYLWVFNSHGCSSSAVSLLGYSVSVRKGDSIVPSRPVFWIETSKCQAKLDPFEPILHAAASKDPWTQ